MAKYFLYALVLVSFILIAVAVIFGFNKLSQVSTPYTEFKTTSGLICVQANHESSVALSCVKP